MEDCVADPYSRRMFAHEVGHALGLRHVSDQSALMHPSGGDVLTARERYHARLLYRVARGKRYCGWPFGPERSYRLDRRDARGRPVDRVRPRRPAVAAVWEPMLAWTTGRPIAQAIGVSFAVVPSYALFAISLMFGSAAATRVTGWRTQPNAGMRLADLDWPLLNWVRYMVATHIVRLFAGTLFRGTPIWSAYLRLNGARVGRRVYVNSLGVSDHNLLEFGDDVVIGGYVHLSGHNGRGRLREDRARALGKPRHRRARIGDRIGVTIGPDVQIGALSLVPKHATLDGGRVYVGVPARPLVRGGSPPDQRRPAARGAERVVA